MTQYNDRGGSQSPSDHEIKYRLRALNANGVLFQERVRVIMEGSGYAFHAAEYGVDTGRPKAGGLYRESKLDLWFRRPIDGSVFNILIECKKADPSLKEWFFFPSTNSSPIFVSDLIRRGANHRWGKARFTTEFATVYAFAGKELKGTWKQKDLDAWKSSSERIDKACDQVTIATESIGERLADQRDMGPQASGRSHFIIPVIATSARLGVCELQGTFYESIDAEISEGEVSFREVDSLVLRYAVSSHLQPALVLKKDELSENFVKATGYLDILICNYQSVASTVEKLCTAISKQFGMNLRK